MSRNFDLMQEAESQRTFPTEEVIAPELPRFSDTKQETDRGQWVNDGALRLVQQIFLLQTKAPPRMVVFAGIDHRSGCSRMAASVAETLAGYARGTVCLVEANFRTPALPAMFGKTNHRGLTDALLREGEIQSFAMPVRSDSLWLLSSGALSADSAGLLSSDRLLERSLELRNTFDFVIVDTPPLTRYADAVTLAQLSDGVVLILEAEATRREAAMTAVENLRSAKIPILGAVLNKRTFPIPEKIYSRL